MLGWFVIVSFRSTGHSFEIWSLSGNRTGPELRESMGKTWNCNICESTCRVIHKLLDKFQALGLWASSAEAWRSAATCLPPLDQFTDTDKRLSLQISEGLQKADAALRRKKEPEIRAFKHTSTMPWLRAEAKLEKLQEEKKVSSVSSTINSVYSQVSVHDRLLSLRMPIG
jgi:hypothetical protein